MIAVTGRKGGKGEGQAGREGGRMLVVGCSSFCPDVATHMFTCRPWSKY